MKGVFAMLATKIATAYNAWLSQPACLPTLPPS